MPEKLLDTNVDSNIAGRKLAKIHLGDVCILGLGVTGRAVINYLLDAPNGRVSSISVYVGGALEPEIIDELNDKGVAVFDNSDALTKNYDLCIASPGISKYASLYVSALDMCDEVIGEVELAWRESSKDSIWIAVTGTNGKTTTTALTAHILNTCGFSAAAVGNIGDSCISLVGADLKSDEAKAEANCLPQNQKGRVYVAEVSSYQLASTSAFAPNVSVLLGITEDHLIWHKTYEDYIASKFKVLDNMACVENAVAILDATNDIVRKKVRELKAVPKDERGFSYIPVGTKAGVTGDMREACGADNAAFLDNDGMLHVAFDGGEYILGAAADLQIKGTHNVLNSLASASAALALGVDARDVIKSLPTFKPLEHRIEPCGVVSGVAYVNDSKATNTDAAIMAVGSFPEHTVVAMLGGRDKLTDLDGLVEVCRTYAKGVVCFGESKERFASAFLPLKDDGIDVCIVDSFDDAFNAASSIATSGDTVLLSPACASFDEFSCFEERGEHFKKLVQKLANARADELKS